MLRSILPRLNICKTMLQPSFVRSRHGFPRHLCTRTELEGELCDIEGGLETLLDLVRHRKAATFLRAVKDYNSEEHPESSDEDRTTETQISLSTTSLTLAHHICASHRRFMLKHIKLDGNTWNLRGRILLDMSIQGSNLGLALVSSLFHNHVQITSNEPIPKSYGVPDPLPLGEPVSYQVKMHDRIKLVVIEQEDLRLPDPEVYTRLFTELYAASLSNKSTMYHYFRLRESMDLRVHDLLADGERNAFFSYDPLTTNFQMDEMVYIKQGRKRALHEMMRLSEKLFSILMHAYKEFLDHWYWCITSLPQEDLIEFKPSDLSLVEEAVQYANLATAQLESPKDEDGLKRGLDYLRKSAWILPIHGKTNNCWLGLDDDLDQMATKAAVDFRRKHCLEEEEWTNGRRHKTYLYCG
ncbi:hypothetical protein ARMSODRAFT_1012797 [Armillaria solidipes]|uniref:Uncharacterized protein n=1 Tax=Armillaria solidipes TaxID=1076256 RepID=A0A2H3CEZ5_9AGAR|nr:hypothetical protein ARMSODRAFT_1012797 [Armillaria solidipes]